MFPEQQKDLIPFIYHSRKYLGFPGSSDGKGSACDAGDLGSIPGLGRSPEREFTPVLLPGETPWTEEPGRLQSMGSQRIGHD